MISLETIEKTILELETRDTSFQVCERLAPLYIVRDHLRGYSVSPEAAIACAESSDFLKAAKGKSPAKIMPLLDELVSTVQLMHPKIYDKFMAELQKL